MSAYALGSSHILATPMDNRGICSYLLGRKCIPELCCGSDAVLNSGTVLPAEEVHVERGADKEELELGAPELGGSKGAVARGAGAPGPRSRGGARPCRLA